MKCTACDCLLTDKEATMKHKKTGDFLDLCGECATFMPSSSISDKDLLMMEVDEGIIDYRDNEQFYLGSKYED